VTTTATAPPPLRSETDRQRELALMKRRATGVLVFMTGVYLVVVLFGGDAGWVGYLRAGAEASMVGGLADWFAVTALFRHPLGLPIPHTAVIAERKDQFGETLGEFVQQNFLSADVVAERVRSSRVVARAAAWLAVPENAERVAAYTADAIVGLADTIRDEDVHRLVEDELRQAVERMPLAKFGAQALRALTAEGRHLELFDAIIRELDHFLEQNREPLSARFNREAPWWLPNAVDDRIFDRLFDGIRTFIRDASNDPNHEARTHFTNAVKGFADRLETSPDLQARADDLKRDLLARPELRTFTSSLWNDAKGRLRTEASDPDSRLRSWLRDAIAATGRRLQDDAALSRKAEELVESGVRFLAERFHDDLAQLVSGTIARWDGDETSRRLELLLGRDLQFIRINGTVVGGVAGLLIHAVGQLIS
jgi:uncharacterized membrane-anchored protein YjiN (DUF445 family)